MPDLAAESGASMYDLVSLGEVMLRLSPPGYERLRQARSLDVRVCGAQFNMAADFALLGGRSAFVSRLPANDLGLLARSACLQYGVDMSNVRMTPNSRMGIVYVDFGVEPRSGAHLYDRKSSAASEMAPGETAWNDILKGVPLAYTDGIFLGLSDGCRETGLEFIRAAKANGAQVCFDVNYRSMIWEPLEAARVYKKIVTCVDVLVTNRSVSESVFGYQGTDEELIRAYRDDFGCWTVCLTARQAMGSKRGAWTSMALAGNEIAHGKPVEFDVVDRLGTGDAFFAGFLYASLNFDVKYALDFGNALCALAHTVEGDVAEISADEVHEILQSGYDFRVRR